MRRPSTQIDRHPRIAEDFSKGSSRPEETPQNAEENYRIIVETSYEGICIFDENFRTIFVNQRMADMLGYRREELLGESLVSFRFDQATRDYEKRRERRRRGIAERFETRLRRKDGAVLWVYVSATPIMDRHNTFQGTFSMYTDITDAKEAEQALRRSEERYRATVASIGDAVITTDAQGHVTFLNRVAEKLTGWTSAEASGQPLEHVFKIISEETGEAAQNPVGRVLREGQVVGLANHTALISRDGREISIEDSAAPIRSTDGEVQGVVMVFHDVTDERRAEAALRRQAALIDLAPDAIIVTCPNGEVTFWSRGAETLYGWTRDQARGQSAHSLLETTFPQPLEQISDQLKQTGRWSGELIHHAKDRREIVAQSYWLAEYDARGEVTGILQSNIDITERRKAEQSLKESEERYRSAIEYSNDGVVVTQEGKHVYVNHRFMEMFGYSGPEEILDKPIADAPHIHPDDVQRIVEWNRQRLCGVAAPSSYEHKAVHKDGRILYVELSSTRIVYDGKAASLSYIRDITRRKEAEETLKRSEEAALQLAREKRVIADIGRIISSSLDIEEVYGRFAEEVRKLIPFDRILINLVNQQEGTLTTAYSAGMEVPGRNKGVVSPLAGSVAEEMIRTRKVALFHAESIDVVRSRYPGLIPAFEAGLRTRLSVLLIAGGTVIGSLALWSKQPRAYGKRDIGLAQSVANQIAGAIANARLYHGRREAEEALRESEAKFRQLFDSANDGIALRDARTFELIDANRTFCQMWGYTLDELKALPLGSLAAHESIDKRRARLLAYYEESAKGVPGLFEWVAKRKDGSTLWVELNVTRIRMGGRECLLTVVRDISKRKKAEEALAISEKRFRDISQAAGEFLFETDPEGRLTFLSDRVVDVLEYSVSDLLGMAALGLMPPLGQSPSLLSDERIPNQTGFRDLERQTTTKSGRLVWLNITAVPIFGDDGLFLGYRGAAMEISDRKRAEEQLLHDAFYDQLTGLPNRALFIDRLGHALRRGSRTVDYACTVIFLDLDRFKVINDSLGHMAGDQLIKETAQRLEKCVRPSDTVARFGGDEFVILFEDMGDARSAKAAADRIQEALSAPVTVEGCEIRCSASIGIAITSREYERPEEVLRDADITMYRAKALGKARCEVFDPSMRLEAAALLHLENDLRRALELHEFRCHYQPILGLEDGKIRGLEVLIRWQHPRRGLVLPEEFIPLAEETGLIVPIGEWVLRTVCSQMKTWREEGIPLIRMAVNVSAIQLRQADFVDMVRRVLEETGIEPGLLDLEITESMLVDRNASTVAVLLKLKALGIRICLDDFGTGYSSLGCLQDLPIDVLKIDRSFTKNLVSDREQAKIVETILMLGKNLGADVIAEGIETREQLDYLKKIHCDHGQGFFLSRPVDEKAMKAMISPK